MPLPRSTAMGVIAPKAFTEQQVSQRWRCLETFNQLPLLNASIGVAANLTWELAGAGAADAGVDFDVDGGVALTIQAGANNQMVIQAHKDAKQSAVEGSVWSPYKLPRFQTQLRLPASLADLVLWFGWKPTETSNATEASSAFVRYEAVANASFQLLTNNGAVPEAINSGFIPEADDEITLAVDFEYDAETDTVYPVYRVGRNYAALDVLGVGQSFAFVNLPPTFHPCVGIQATAGVITPELVCRWIDVSQQRFLGTLPPPLNP